MASATARQRESVRQTACNSVSTSRASRTSAARLMREQRSIRRIKDDSERAARETAWQSAFDALSEELDQRVAERGEAVPRGGETIPTGAHARKGPPEGSR